MHNSKGHNHVMTAHVGISLLASAYFPTCSAPCDCNMMTLYCTRIALWSFSSPVWVRRKVPSHYKVPKVGEFSPIVKFVWNCYEKTIWRRDDDDDDNDDAENKLDADPKLKDCTDRLVIAETKDWMTAIDKLFNVLTTPQNAVTPRRRATLLTVKFHTTTCQRQNNPQSTFPISTLFTSVTATLGVFYVAHRHRKTPEDHRIPKRR